MKNCPLSLQYDYVTPQMQCDYVIPGWITDKEYLDRKEVLDDSGDDFHNARDGATRGYPGFVEWPNDQ